MSRGRLTDKAVTAQADSYERRMIARMERESASGTVFFKGPVEVLTQELKLDHGKLIFIRWVAGGDSDGGDNQCFMLRRLESFDWGRRSLKLKGEFLHQYGPTLHTVIEKKARVTRKTLSVSLSLDNEDVLREFLEKAVSDSQSIRSTDASERLDQYVDKEIAPTGRSLMFLVRVPGMVAGSVRYRTVDGTLLGFVEVGGKHYPEYTYHLPDGCPVRAVDRDTALEDMVDEAMAMRVLARRCPRDVTVRCSRCDPRESTCIYL